MACASVSLSWAAGCVPPPHRPPAPGKPSAVVKFRIGHQYRPSAFVWGAVHSYPPSLHSLLTIDNRRLDYVPVNHSVVATWTRVRPGWRVYRLGSWFSQQYLVSVQEVYYETRYKSCTRYKCSYSYGYGGYKHRCGYKTEMCTKRERKYRTVQRSRWRTVARCAHSRAVYMRNGATYLLTYNYLGPGSCRIDCHEQIFMPDGRFRMVLCRYVR